MKFLLTATHAFIDYFTALVLLVSPWLMGFAPQSLETWVFMIAGISIIIYCLLTNYKLGALKVIPMPIHVWIDVVAGIFLALSPWVFHFAGRVYIPHLMIGRFEITIVFFTQSIPSYQESKTVYKKYL